MVTNSCVTGHVIFYAFIELMLVKKKKQNIIGIEYIVSNH